MLPAVPGARLCGSFTSGTCFGGGIALACVVGFWLCPFIAGSLVFMGIAVFGFTGGFVLTLLSGALGIAQALFCVAFRLGNGVFPGLLLVQVTISIGIFCLYFALLTR